MIQVTAVAMTLSRHHVTCQEYIKTLKKGKPRKEAVQNNQLGRHFWFIDNSGGYPFFENIYML